MNHLILSFRNLKVNNLKHIFSEQSHNKKAIMFIESYISTDRNAINDKQKPKVD